jgi:hypothetical protein
MTEQEKNLIALLDSSDEANIALALILQQQLQSPIVEKRINDYQKMLELYAATDRRYTPVNSLSEDLPHLNFRSYLSDTDLPHIFSIQYYAWGGQSMGFEETPEDVKYSIYRTLLYFNLEDWFISNKTDKEIYDHNWSKSIIQIWVTYRLVEILPIFELLAKHWDDTPDMDYYFGEIYFERGDYSTAQQYFTKYVDAVPDGVSAISRYSDRSNYRFYKNKEYAPEEWHLLPQRHWSILKINAVGDSGSHPDYHALAPNTMEARIFLAQIASKQNDLLEAEKQYDLAIALCPEHWLAPHLPLAELLLYSPNPHPKKINKALAHLRHFWQNIAAINPQKYTHSASAWHGWHAEYGRLADYLTQRYPLLYTGVNYYYIAERYFLAAEQLRQLKADLSNVFDLLHTSATAISTTLSLYDLKKMTAKPFPNIFYARRPRLIFELLAALKQTSQKHKTKDLRIMAYSQLIKCNWQKIATAALIEKIQLIWQHYRDRSQVQILLNKYAKWLSKNDRCHRILLRKR